MNDEIAPVPEPEAVPDELRERDQWLMWDASSETPRRPHWRGDFSISWSTPDDWHRFEDALEAARERENWGIGYVFARTNDDYPRGLYGALDLDGCLDADGRPKDWLPSLAPFIDAGAYIERSPSVAGLHIPLVGFDPPEWWSDSHFSDDEHEGVEAYGSKFFTVTGDTIDASGDQIAEIDPTGWLVDAYEAITGETPTFDGPSESGDIYEGDTEIGVYDVLSRSSYPEGERRSHPHHPSGTGANFHVDDDETFRCWRHGVTGNGGHLLGMELGIIDCGDWEPTGLSSETWREIFDAARENGYDIPAAASADGGTASVDVEELGTDIETTADTIADWDVVKQFFDSNERGSTTRGYNRAAEVLNKHHSFVTIRETGELYFYDSDQGHYVRKGRSFIAELLEEHIPGLVNIERRKNICQIVESKTYHDADAFAPPEGKLCVENGVLDLETRTLEAHSSNYYFTSRLQTPYIEGANATRWDQFLAEATTTDEARKLEEFIGYALEAWHHDREKNLFIVGPRQSGKSTFADTVQALFGPMPTVTNLTPQQIADTQFDAASLKEAALNAVNDINATKIEDTGTLKRVFSGERMKIERKYQDALFGAPKAKHLFSANWLPTVIGQDESLYRRVLIVEFPHKVDDDDRDRQLKQKLEAELPGILNRALDARDRLYEQGGFTNDRTTDDTRRMWDSWLDAHKRFLYTQFEITGDSEDIVEKETYYQAYKEYSGREGYELKPKQGVTKSLQWVPEIDVREDDYAGLVWRSTDAAESKGIDHTDSIERSQDELTSTVTQWILEFSTPTTPAQRTEILEHAERKGEDPDRVTHTIDKLCENGTLWKPENGGLRVT